MKQSVPDASALERHGRRLERAARVQRRLGRPEVAAEIHGRALALLQRAVTAWQGQGRLDRAQRVERLLRRRPVEAAPSWWRRARGGLLAALPLIATLLVWFDALRASWELRVETPWLLAGGLAAAVVLMAVGAIRRWRVATVALMVQAALLLVILLAAWRHPTVGAGAVALSALDPLDVAYLGLAVAALTPLGYVARWVPWALWVPTMVLGGYGLVPLVMGATRRLPLEDTPLLGAFWSAWPAWAHPMPAMVFIYTPVMLGLLLLALLIQWTARDHDPAPEDLLMEIEVEPRAEEASPGDPASGGAPASSGGAASGAAAKLAASGRVASEEGP